MKTFQELGLSELSLSTVAQLGFENPTEVQQKTIPMAMEKRDLIVSAQTGSGKTAAYALPIIEEMMTIQAPKRTIDENAKADLAAQGKSMRRMPRWQKMKYFKFEPIATTALVVVPTRELALQVKEQFIQLNANKALHVVALYGGADYMKQGNALKRGAHVIIATPGRLIDFLEKGQADLSQAKMIVLDEADRLLDLGFTIQVNEILKYLPEEKQVLVFSATIDKRVAEVANAYQKNPLTIKINTGRIEPSTIDQKIHYLKEKEKEAKLLELITEAETGSILVFTQTKVKATQVADRLREANFKADEIHGDIRQKQRERTLDRFRQGEFQVLIATDVAARGLDIPAISHVINYDLPLSSADYVHRIGRTGRAGRSGIAHSFVSEGERYLLGQIERVVGRQLGDGRSGRDPGGKRNKWSDRRDRDFSPVHTRVGSGGGKSRGAKKSFFDDWKDNRSSSSADRYEAQQEERSERRFGSTENSRWSSRPEGRPEGRSEGRFENKFENRSEHRAEGGNRVRTSNGYKPVSAGKSRPYNGEYYEELATKKPAYKSRSTEGRSYGNNEGRSYGNGEKRSYGNSEGRPSYGGGGEGRSYGNGEKRSYGNSEGRSYGKTEGRSYGNSEGRPSYGGGGAKKPGSWGGKKPVGAGAGGGKKFRGR